MHWTAKLRADGAGWHYVAGQIPLGYCADHGPHATEDEARECYARWQRDHVAIRKTSQWHNCEHGKHPDRCPNPANNVAEVRGQYMSDMSMLCDEHATLEHAIIALGLDQPAGDCWVS